MPTSFFSLPLPLLFRLNDRKFPRVPISIVCSLVWLSICVETKSNTDFDSEKLCVCFTTGKKAVKIDNDK